MEKDKGVLYLKSLYDFVREFKDDGESGYRLKEPIKKVANRYSYSDQCVAILDDNPNHDPKHIGNPFLRKRGFYLWGFYNHRNFWVNVYLGMSEKGKKTSDLRARIMEELKDDRAFVWREFCPTDKVMALDPKYQTVVRRALRKAGSTHIFWVAEPHLAQDEFESIEYDLIEAMNPTGNRRRLTPSKRVQPEAGKILNIFREMIHEVRVKDPTTRFKLKYHKEFWRWVGEAEPSTP
jgi:hypothetical protein